VTGEVGFLKTVTTYPAQPAECYLTIDYEGEPYIGGLMVEDPAFCQTVARFLETHVGRSIKEIGDLDATDFTSIVAHSEQTIPTRQAFTKKINELPGFPPIWISSDGRYSQGLKGILQGVVVTDNDRKTLAIGMEYNNELHVGSLTDEPPVIEKLVEILRKNLGEPLEVVGEMEIELE
jgi:hypothetical protein